MKFILRRQEIRFALIGILNTALDFAVFNVLIFFFGLGGVAIVAFRTIAFAAAVANSYAWNKKWVFNSEHATRKELAKEQISFLLINLLGLFLNTSIATAVYTLLISSILSAHLVVAANIGTLAGILFVFSMNFVGYKFFVFSKKPL